VTIVDMVFLSVACPGQRRRSTGTSHLQVRTFS